MIEKAITAEQEYLQKRLSDEDVTLDLSEYGYESLDTYFADKKEYQLKHCGIQMYELPMNDALDQFAQAIHNKTPGVWIPTADSVFVWHGSEPIDTALCDELGVRIHDMNYIGGTIVSGAEDLSFAIIIPEAIDIGTSYVLERLREAMSKYLDDVIIDGNDILVGGVKVLGSMNRRVNGVYIFACQISYADRTELISKLCSKQSDKTPGYIDGSKLPKQTLKNEVFAWLS